MNPWIDRDSVQFSHSVMSDSLQPHESQHSRPPCPSPTPGVHPNSCALNWWCHPAISSSVVPFSSCPQSLPASGLFQWLNSSHEVAKVLEFQLQHQSFQRTPRADLLQKGLVWSPCSSRDSQESSPTPQFKSINSLALSCHICRNKKHIIINFLSWPSSLRNELYTDLWEIAIQL